MNKTAPSRLSVKNLEAYNLARHLSEKTGMSLTHVVLDALRYRASQLDTRLSQQEKSQRTVALLKRLGDAKSSNVR